MADSEVQYVSDETGQPVSVIVPIKLWREIESERETAYLLRSAKMKERLLQLLVENKSVQTPHGDYPLAHFVASSPISTKLSAADAKVSESNRDAMAQDLLDVAAMADWANANAITHVAMSLG